jgi:uncharacterized protein (UPF0333 family)
MDSVRNVDMGAENSNAIPKSPNIIIKKNSTVVKKSNVSMKKIILVLVFLVVLLGATTFYFYKNSKSTDSIVDQKEAQTLSDIVGKIALVPKDEVPTIATVSDPEALRDQSFFVDAKQGDKVLIYTNAKRAILYDPIANKIINIAPLNTSDQKKIAPAPTPTTVPDEDSAKKGQF